MGDRTVSRWFLRARMAIALGLILLSAVASERVSRALSDHVVAKAMIADALDDAQMGVANLMLSFVELPLAQDVHKAQVVRGEMRRARRLVAASRAEIIEAVEAKALGAATDQILRTPALDPLGGLADLDRIAERLEGEDAPYGAGAARAAGVGHDVARRLLPLLKRMKETERAAHGEASHALRLGGGAALAVSFCVALATWFLIFLPLERRVIGAQAELQEKRRAAEQASEAKTRFLATLSHEIRTPMNGVMGMAELLGSTSLSARQRRMVDIVVKSGAALTQIIDTVLDLAKIESGRYVLEREPFDLRRLCEETAALFSGAAEAKGLELRCVIEDGLSPAYLGDAGAVRQALSNLVGNAVKFTNEGEVRLRARASAGRVLLSVSDTGVGVASEAQARIFESFEQADPSTARRFGGTGLGLAIVKRLAETMGGSVALESEAGAGSTFTLALPLSAADAPSRAPESAAPAAGLLLAAGRCVLVAEDNAVNQIIVREMLRNAGCEVVMAENGREAVAAYEAASPDLVLMDVSMPDMDGYEAAQEIRAIEARKGVAGRPIIALSAHAMAEHRERALAAGMNDFITKPIVPQALRSALERHLTLRRGPRPDPRNMEKAS